MSDYLTARALKVLERCVDCGEYGAIVFQDAEDEATAQTLAYRGLVVRVDKHCYRATKKGERKFASTSALWGDGSEGR